MRISVPGLIYGLVYIVLLGWVGLVSVGLRDSPFFLASLLGLSAFVIMWAHYFNGFLREAFFPDSKTKTLYKITKYVVSFCIIVHPILISYYLISKGYGLPPLNYSNFFGATKTIFVYLGLISLGIFIVFDFKEKLSKKNQTIIEHLSNLAMVLIVIHGLVLGYVLQNNTNQIIFYILGVTLLLMLGRIYMKERNKTLSIAGILLVAIALAVVSFIVFKPDDKKVSTNTENQTTSNQSTEAVAQAPAEQQSTTSGTKKITAGELSAKKR